MNDAMMAMKYASKLADKKRNKKDVTSHREVKSPLWLDTKLPWPIRKAISAINFLLTGSTNF